MGPDNMNDFMQRINSLKSQAQSLRDALHFSAFNNPANAGKKDRLIAVLDALRPVTAALDAAQAASWDLDDTSYAL